MTWDGIWRLQDPPMSGDQVRLIQRKALVAFSSYAVPLGVQINGLYDRPTRDFVTEFQRRKNDSGYKPRLPSNPAAQPGDTDFATKQALGILPITPTVLPPPKYVGYAVPGTWGVWNIGPQCMAINRQPDRVFLQGVGYNTSAFLSPDPMHSYVEARSEGVGELLRLALPDPRPKFFVGYSMGADVVTRTLYEWPADRRHEITAVIKFGDPGHLPGRGIVGANSINGGISGIYTPDWVVDRTYSYQISGDMYGDAPGLLPAIYDILTRMEMSFDFMLYLFTWLTGIPLSGTNTNAAAPTNQIGAQLLGLASGAVGSMIPGFGALSGILGMITGGPLSSTSGPVSLAAMLLNLPAIISTLIAALKFVFTNAHGRYWIDPIFEGMTAEDHAASVVRKLAV